MGLKIGNDTSGQFGLVNIIQKNWSHILIALLFLLANLPFDMPTDALPHFADQLKALRKSKGWTQQELADQLGLKRAALGAYEEGRAEPRLANVLAISDIFGVSADALMRGKRKPADRTSGKDMRILTIPVGKESGEEHVAVVPVRAAAGYLDGYGDPEFIQNLPVFDLPIPEVSPYRTYRLFQIEGESMLPVPSGSYILASYEPDWNHAGGMRPYIVVTRNEGIIFKRIENRLDGEGHDFRMISDNPDFPPFLVNPEDISEVWRAQAYLAFDWPTPAFSGMERIQGTLDSLRQEITSLQQGLPSD
jgi:transcriptional regulator with XRE-family HTH domain